jgi:putative transposase
VIVDYIDAHRDRFGVAPICAVLAEHGTSIAPSTYYATIHHRVSMADLDDAYRANELFDLHCADRGVYGRRKLWHAARRAGLPVGVATRSND